MSNYIRITEYSPLTGSLTTSSLFDLSLYNTSSNTYSTIKLKVSELTISASNIVGIIPTSSGGTGTGSLLVSTFISPSIDRTTTTSSATDVTDLQFNLNANKKYFVRGPMHISCDNTGGVKFGYVTPSGSTFIIFMQSDTTSATVYQEFQRTAAGLSGTPLCTRNGHTVAWLSGTITTGNATGSFSIQFASATLGQTSTVYSEGTCIELIPLN